MSIPNKIFFQNRHFFNFLSQKIDLSYLFVKKIIACDRPETSFAHNNEINHNVIT